MQNKCKYKPIDKIRGMDENDYGKTESENEAAAGEV
jgi:hypothetical protein